VYRLARKPRGDDSAPRVGPEALEGRRVAADPPQAEVELHLEHAALSACQIDSTMGTSPTGCSPPLEELDHLATELDELLGILVIHFALEDELYAELRTR
jgi:hypothetical protein